MGDEERPSTSGLVPPLLSVCTLCAEHWVAPPVNYVLVLHPSKINSYVVIELQEGRIPGLFPPGSVPGLHTEVVLRGTPPIFGGSSPISPT